MEQIDGNGVGHGTAHCDVYPGGICNEGTGLGAAVNIPGNGFQTWRLQWDRTPADWTKETITWSMSGNQYHTLTGAQIGNQAVWKTLCNDPMFFILNVAVGGGWVSTSYSLFMCYFSTFSDLKLTNFGSIAWKPQRKHWNWRKCWYGSSVRCPLRQHLNP